MVVQKRMTLTSQIRKVESGWEAGPWRTRSHCSPRTGRINREAPKVYHPLPGGLLNFEAGRLLLQHGDTTRAIRLLGWWANVDNFPRHAPELYARWSGTLELGRVAEAQGKREEALHHYREFLRRYDMPVAAHRHLVTERRQG
jgi:hypothetical protein